MIGGTDTWAHFNKETEIITNSTYYQSHESFMKLTFSFKFLNFTVLGREII